MRGSTEPNPRMILFAIPLFIATLLAVTLSACEHHVRTLWWPFHTTCARVQRTAAVAAHRINLTAASSIVP